jgi:hypothetical protein
VINKGVFEYNSMLSHGGTPWAEFRTKESHICGVLKIPCRERAVTVPQFCVAKLVCRINKGVFKKYESFTRLVRI